MRRRLQGWIDDLAVTKPGAPPQLWDWLVLALLVAVAATEWILDPTDYLLASALVSIPAFALLPFRRQIPLQAALIAFTATLAVEIGAAIRDAEFFTSFGHSIAGLMLVYAICRWLPPQRAAYGMIAVVTMATIGEAVGGVSLLESVLLAVPWLVLAAFALAMRYRARLRDHHDDHIRLAERNALARELHDSVAHHVSAIAVQAQAAQFIADSNPEAAVKAMRDVEEIANTTIDEMRRMVGILRSDEDYARTVAGTNLEPLADPNGRPRVTITGESELSELPRSVAAAIYRIAQESVTNARRHSRNVTFVDIGLQIDDITATLDVSNDGTPTTRNSGGGYGLVGMKERVDSLGGTITVGPRPASGWQVHADIPLGRPT